MQSHNYESFITQTVETMLPRFSSRDICLTMKVAMEWTHYHKNAEKQTSFRKEVFLIFHRPSNYTKVLYKDISDNQRFYIPSDIKMKQLSDHDSCWRSDGMRWVFESFCEAWDYFEKHGIDGRQIEPIFRWSGFQGAPRYHQIHLELENKSDRWNSDYNVLIGEKIEMNEIGEYMPKI